MDRWIEYVKELLGCHLTDVLLLFNVLDNVYNAFLVLNLFTICVYMSTFFYLFTYPVICLIKLFIFFFSQRMLAEKGKTGGENVS